MQHRTRVRRERDPLYEGLKGATCGFLIALGVVGASRVAPDAVVVLGTLLGLFWAVMRR